MSVRGVGRRYVSKRSKFRMDSLEKALFFLDEIRQLNKRRQYGILICLKEITDEYPEIFKCTHEHISELIGVSREEVTRAMAFYSERKKKWVD